MESDEFNAWLRERKAISEPCEQDGWEHVHATGEAAITINRRGARIKFRPRSNVEPVRGDRGAILDMSSRSRLDAAYAFENATCNWYCMTLLTWQETPDAVAVKRARREFSERFRGRWGEGLDGWILEMHRRGVPHIHLFHAAESNFGLECRAAEKRIVARESADGESHDTQLVCGTPEWWMRETWMDCIGNRNAQTMAFNKGGIVEVFRNPAGAARYVAKESSKRYQKELPERYADGLGRWWYLNKRWKPVTEFKGTVSVDALRHELGWERPLSRVWDAETVALAITEAHVPRTVLEIDVATGAVRVVPHSDV